MGIANELRERALPDGIEWPRFEDGEPVGIGDEVSVGGEPWKVRCAILREECWALSVECDYDTATVRGDYGERVMRPVVLDANGFTIEVGDVVYYADDPHPMTVVGIARDGKGALVDANGEESCVEGGKPQDFSHEAPKPKVLDADGAPIEVGDTVYLRSNGRKGEVTGFYEEDGVTWVAVSYELGGDRMTVNTEGKALTHERPDSWERIEKDAYHLVMSEYLETPEDDVRDIVRRAKALAKAGE